MFSHVMVGSNDVARSKKFCWARLAASPRSQGPAAIPAQWRSAHGEQAWHKAGIADGGTAIEDLPGVHQGSAGAIYLAYLRDPDGNKLCAVHRIPTG